MDYESGAVERPEDIEVDRKGIVRRWLLELKLADKREEKWREKSEKIWKRYRQNDSRRHSFNILWSNTETLRPAIYNSLPQPDVRRRYKDADPLGKAVAETLNRALTYGLDTTDFDGVAKATVLDMLLPGRGVARVRYVPSLRQVGITQEAHVESEEVHADGGEALEGDTEELEWEQAPVEHVQWDDFRMSAGKEWSEVCWIAFKHRLTRDELEEQFSDVGSLVQLDATDDEDIKAEQDQAVADAFKTAEVWEIWDKDRREVLFVAKGYKEAPLKVLPDPLNLTDFWPIPKPAYAVEDSGSMLPTPLYELYREQADELDAVSRRINIIVKGLKLRGIYDSTLSELAEVMRGEDNDLIPAQNAAALIERGGLEKAVLWMPIEMAANVLKVLYEQREMTKQVIYEITGISDILRGATKATETATAQQIKAQWGSARLDRMKAEVARFIRDLLRLQAEIIGEKFQPETLATMTGLNLPTQEQAAMMAMQAQQQGQPAPQVVTWEQVVQVLRDDKMRTFKVDIETDSTTAATVQSDMSALKDLLGGLTQLIQGFGPAVQLGAMPMEALKEIIMAVTRRAKLGNAVEDALDKMQQPQPQQQPQDNSPQVEQIKQQGEAQRLQMEQQHTAQIEQSKMQHEAHLELVKQQAETERERMKVEAENDYAWRCEQLKAETQIIVATIGAQQKAQSEALSAQNEAARMQMDAENQAVERESQAQEKAEGEAKHTELQETIAKALEGFQAAVERLSAPRSVVRGPDGRVAGIQ